MRVFLHFHRYLEREFSAAERDGVIPKGSNVSGSWSTLTEDGELLNLNLVHLSGDALDPWHMSRLAVQVTYPP